MSETKALEAKVRVLEAQVKSLMNPPKPKAVKKDATLVLCSWARAPVGAGIKCGWRGRADKYQMHLGAKHLGKEYKPPKTGLPAKGD